MNNQPPQNPIPGGRSGGIKLPPMNIQPQNPGGRSGGVKMPPVDNQNPIPGGRSGGVKMPPVDNQNPTPGGRSGGVKMPPVDNNPTPGGRSGIKMPPIDNQPPQNPGGRSGGFKMPQVDNQNPVPGGRSGGRSTPQDQNPIPGGRSGGRATPITPVNTLGRTDNVPPQNLPPPTFPTNIPPPVSFPQNIPPPIKEPPKQEPPKPQPQPQIREPLPVKQPTKVVMPQITIPVKVETTRETPKSHSSLIAPTFLVVSSNTVSGKFLGPLNYEGIKEVSSQKVKVSGNGPHQPVVSAPLYRTAKPWEMPFKVPEIEANVEYIQPTAPLETLPKVHREPQRKIKGDAWNKVKGPLMLYSKIKKNLMLETCNRKEKKFMAIYFNWIIFWGSTGNKPDESEDMPNNYFDLDNVLDSTEIKINEKKNELTLPLLPNMGAKNVKFSFDEVEDLRNWWKETKKIVAVLEKTDRSDMVGEDMIKMKLGEINLIFPEKNFVPNGLKGVIDWQKAGEWFAEMKNFYTQQRLISRYLRKVRLFQQYAIGPIGSYTNWFFGSEGPHITLGKVEEVVFGNWINIINETEKLIKELLNEPAIDSDHLPYHMEDCQIAVHIIDLMNWYPTYVHNVKREPQFADKAIMFKQYYAQLSLKPVCQ